MSNGDRAGGNGAMADASRSGFLICSRFGQRGNFELIVPNASHGVLHFWKSNDDGSDDSWHLQERFACGERLQYCESAALIQSNYASNFETVVRIGNSLWHWHRDRTLHWCRPIEVATHIAGHPALIQSRFGSRGNFEVVVPSTGNGLRHYYRDNDSPSQHWLEASPFAADEGHFQAAALIHSRLGEQLEVVATAGTQLLHYYRDEDRNWQGPFLVTEDVCGTPALIQGLRGIRGHFEVVVPTQGSGLRHCWLDNDRRKVARKPHQDIRWNVGDCFGESAGCFQSVSIVVSPRDRRLEAVGITGNLLFHFRSDDDFRWSDGNVLGRRDQTCSD